MLINQSILGLKITYISSNPVEVTGNYSLIKRSLYLVSKKTMNKGFQNWPLKGGLLNEKWLKTCPSEPALCSCCSSSVFVVDAVLCMNIPPSASLWWSSSDTKKCKPERNWLIFFTLLNHSDEKETKGKSKIATYDRTVL